MSDRITDLLHAVADDVEPDDRLDAIRAEIGVRRPGRGWWAAGGAGLVAASVVAALVLTTGGGPGTDPVPAEPGPSRTTPTQAPRPDQVSEGVPVYFVGDTPDGARLFRETRYVDAGYGGDALSGVVNLALGRASDGSPRPPLDPDYRVPWPEGVAGTAALDQQAGIIAITLSVLTGGSEALRDRGGLSAHEATLAIEQLVRTVQDVTGSQAPVRFSIDGRPTDQVLGVPTTEPVAGGPDLGVVAPVSLTEPREGLRVDNDESIIVRGTTFAADGAVTTRIQSREGTFVAAEQVDRVGLANEGPVSFTATFTLGELPPGDYVVISEVTDPSGSLTTDTRRITVVD